VESLYSHAVSLAVPVFISLVGVEFAVDCVRRSSYYHFADAVSNLSCGMISTGMRIFFGFVGLFVYEWTLANLAPGHLSSAIWLTCFTSTSS
jgi:hypothetical protein